MIKFFRHIRYKLMNENKTGRYFKYAIGEIILVVIGILIALQINNWNELNKTRHTEVQLLKELKEDLEETKLDLITDIAKAKKILLITDTLYRKITDENYNNPIKISTSYLLETSMLFPKLSAYEALQSIGITIVSNTQLRKNITDLYQLHLTRITASELYTEDLNQNVIKPYLISNSKFGSNCTDCKDLFSLYGTLENRRNNFYIVSNPDDRLVHLLKEKFDLFYELNKRYEGLALRMDEIIALIDKEIKA
ncbi:DUF6090 family protein [Winogradskyella sp. A3E31]|uniref:DUF6090 family protein n=1 Tax=Winogradskyella sp. A3E31 TaxID=3349637 RepID=UPI00398AEB5A